MIGDPPAVDHHVVDVDFSQRRLQIRPPRSFTARPETLHQRVSPPARKSTNASPPASHHHPQLGLACVEREQSLLSRTANQAARKRKRRGGGQYDDNDRPPKYHRQIFTCLSTASRCRPLGRTASSGAASRHRTWRGVAPAVATSSESLCNPRRRRLCLYSRSDYRSTSTTTTSANEAGTHTAWFKLSKWRLFFSTRRCLEAP